MRLTLFGMTVLYTALACGTAMAQQQESRSCTFADGKSLSISFTPAPAEKELARAEPWSPGNQPLLMFTEVPTQIAGATIPIGAFRLYIVPDKQQWTLVVNRNVNAGAAYDKADDLVRAPMPLETLPSKEGAFQAYLGHIAPQQCSLRLDYGKTRATLLIDEKP